MVSLRFTAKTSDRNRFSFQASGASRLIRQLVWWWRKPKEDHVSKAWLKEHR